MGEQPFTEPSPGGDPTIFVLQRELCEVHLLLDNISSNAEKTLSLGGEDAKKLGNDWLMRICQIDWPPDGSVRDRAVEADLLIRVKDYLNNMAKPASGLTIAFTHLVTKEAGTLPDCGDSGHVKGDGPSRVSLAAGAYPDLVGKAKTFRKWVQWISLFLLAWLIITCFASWYVAYGNSVLTQRKAAQAELLAAKKLVEDRLGSGQSSGSAGVGSTSSDGRGGRLGQGSQEITPRDCQEASTPKFASRLTALQRAACSDMSDAKSALESADRQVGIWLILRKGPAGAETSSRVGILVAIWATAVLPVFYGILGAGAAILRNLSRKMRSSLLAPRDLNLALQQLALGAVTGACIGIFVAQPSTEGASEVAGVLGPAGLSASAISFLAGFGVDAVFGTLEAIITRVFSLKAPEPAPSPGV